MDAALLQQRKDFLQHAAKNVSVQIKPSSSSVDGGHSTYNPDTQKKKKKPNPPAHASMKNNLESFDFKVTTTHANAMNFSTMAKIVDYMKKRHLNAQPWGLALKEILDEIQVFDLNKRAEAWLQEALPKNPKLVVDSEGKFIYQPPLKIKGRSSMISVLTKHHQDGKGGILLSQIAECIPNAEKVLESAGKEIVVVNTSVNKRKDKVVFWNDPGYDFELDDEYKTLWRSVGVDHLDEKKIEEYLQKHGIEAMKDLAPKKVATAVPKRKAPKRRTNGKVHNEHLSDVLQDYQ